MGDHRHFLHYRDDGPDEICGQMMSLTSPRSHLLIYEGPHAERDAWACIRHFEVNNNGRRNPRIEDWWAEGEYNVLPGPIFAAGQEGS